MCVYGRGKKGKGDGEGVREGRANFHMLHLLYAPCQTDHWAVMEYIHDCFHKGTGMNCSSFQIVSE